MRYLFTVFFLLITSLLFAQTQTINSIPEEGIVLNKGWKFKAGDNIDWAKPDFDDSGWQAIDPTLDVYYLPQLREQPVGWLRIHFRVDSSLLNKPFAYHVFQSIASQVYINGALTDSFGVVSIDRNKIVEWRPSNNPEGIVFTQPEQTVAVRFSWQHDYYSNFTLISAYNGFIFRLSDVKRASAISELVHQFPTEHLLLFTFFFVVSFVNLLLYVSTFKKGYFLGFLTYCLLSVAYLLTFFVAVAGTTLTFIGNAQIVIHVVLFSSPLLLYLTIRSVFASEKNFIYWLNISLVVITLSISSFPFVKREAFLLLLGIITITNGIEATRIIISAYRRGNKKAFILIAGFTIYWLLYFVMFLLAITNTGYDDNTFNLIDLLWVIAFLSNPVCLVIYITTDFADTSKELATKLLQVKELSNEKQQILLSQNETLEQQVVQRTSQLTQSIHELKITQAQLVQSEKRQSQQIDRLNEEVLNRTEEVNTMKQTLASDFHDETGNLLSAITRQASLLKMNDGYNHKGATVIDNIIANSNQLYASSRHFLWNLNNDSNDPHKLFEYLLSFGQGFYNNFGISFSADNRLPADFPGRLLPFAPLNLIFIFKEAINNVAKHAGAAEVMLEVTAQNELIVFALTDDGTWQEPDRNVSHHGLHNMERRCAQNKFRFAISHPGNTGTRIEVGAPFITSP